MRGSGRPKGSRTGNEDEAAPLDPVALTLAVWLGLIACVTGVIRLSDNAAAQAALARNADARLQMEIARNFATGN